MSMSLKMLQSVSYSKVSPMPDRFWGGNFTDQTIEQELMRLFKSSSGMTCGRGMNESIRLMCCQL